MSTERSGTQTLGHLHNHTFLSLRVMEYNREKSSENDGALENQKYYRNGLFYHRKRPNCVLGFSAGAFLGWTSQPGNTDVNIMEQTPCFRKHEKCWKKRCVSGFTPWGISQFWGHSPKLIQKDGHLLSILRIYIFTR